jgi:hypothetical protein
MLVGFIEPPFFGHKKHFTICPLSNPKAKQLWQIQSITGIFSKPKQD